MPIVRWDNPDAVPPSPEKLKNWKPKKTAAVVDLEEADDDEVVLLEERSSNTKKTTNKKKRQSETTPTTPKKKKIGGLKEVEEDEEEEEEDGDIDEEEEESKKTEKRKNPADYLREKAKDVVLPSGRALQLNSRYLYNNEGPLIIHMCKSCRKFNSRRQPEELEEGMVQIPMALCAICRANMNHQSWSKFFHFTLPLVKRDGAT